MDESADFSGFNHPQMSSQRNKHNHQRKGVLSAENFNRDAFVDVNGCNRVGGMGDLFDNRKNSSYQMMNESRSAFLMNNRGSLDRTN